ncbi:beta-ketoacyl synthase N-terminal-like domain-containing protein [Amycolatopsis ultiminotia]|uniref:Beta-ketoacyl synthase N-terminal-like domain-containing protein n=1 Tax=Amycolatopsis ultiminotia TaxID=543629 RepID=A0ABP6V2S1_9PSEU
MNREVVVTGFAVRTGFGEGAEATRHGVFGGRSALAPVTRFDTAPFRASVAATDGTPGPGSLRDALSKCAGDAVAAAGHPAGEDTAVLVGTAGDFTGVTGFWRRAEHTSGSTAGDTVAARQADLVAEHVGARGPRLAFTNACVASAVAIIHACRLIATGRLDSAVCAGGYLVEEENFAKFDSGMAFSRDGVVRPFSAGRSGLLLGDGAAAIVLEAGDTARRRGARPLAAVIGWGMAADAHHVARPHPQARGLASAAGQALRRAGDPDGRWVDYVNAHGTATKTNDPAETAGLRTVFGSRADAVPVSSTKGATGHLLEAAGAVEFVITMMAMLDGVLPPTAGYTAPDPDCDLDVVPNQPRRADVWRALTVNAAFGGANTALLLERR